MEWALKTILSLVLILGEGVVYGLFGVENFTLQLGLALTIVLGLSRDFSSSAFILIMILWPMEWAIRGERGHYVFAAVTLFFLLRFLSAKLKTSIPQLFFISFCAGMVHSSVMILTTFLLNPDSTSLPSILSNIVWAAFLVSFGALFIQKLFDFLGSFYTVRRENALGNL